MGQVLEKDIEELIEDSFVQNGYTQSISQEFDRDNCINVNQLITFLETTQKNLLEEFKKARGQKWEEKLLAVIDSNIRQKGLIQILRDGISDFSLSKNLRLIYFKPNNKKNQETIDLYKANIFSITRQLYFEKTAKTSIDIVLFINGLPLVIIELKNKYTGQNTKDAEKQFRLDRSYRTKLSEFNTRTLIYFAVDNDEVTMTTELKGEDTFFLPFNKGVNDGAGNPTVKGKLKTYYLWEEILLKDSLLDIFRNFYFIKTDEKDPKKKTAIFPRYHQLDVIKELERTVKEEKVGHKYLIQHSAGSGKTNSISWLAHRLSKLHDEGEQPIFDCVIVITDRKVLDTQLQKSIYQLDKTKGLVVKIDEKKNSNDLVEALEKGSKIIISTIQKFAHAYKKIENLQRKKYAIIIDEAHSSTSGENINYLKQTLAGKTLDEAKEIDAKISKSPEDEINETIESLTNTKHLSFFAFTATPKDKTMQIFGRIGDDDLPHEFHLYSMRQAIEERFILDPLKNYMISETYFKIGKRIKENPSFDKTSANKAIGKFVSLNEYNIKEKVAVIVEDFMTNRALWLNNKAKSMIVTSSRLHALKYKFELDKYLATHYPFVKSLVAFSGELEFEDIKYSEESINTIKESELADVFDEEDSIKFLVVADKYQTGFDQPKLCAMYVDKMLNGVTAVQTLSRLNRVTKGKDNTFVLDFVNDAKTIRDSFSRYYTSSNVEEMTDPNIIFEFHHNIDEFHVLYEDEIHEYVKLYIKDNRDGFDIANMDNLVNFALERFNDIQTIEQQDEFKTYVIKFFRAYNFLIQIYPIKRVELYEMYIFLGGLISKFPKNNISTIDLTNLLSLDYYKLKLNIVGDKNEEDISLEKEDVKNLKGFSSGGTRTKEKEEEDLDNLINNINNLFGMELKDEDRLVFEQQIEAHFSNEDLKNIAKVNSFDEFEKQFDKKYFYKTLVEKKSTNEVLFNKAVRERDFRDFLIQDMANKLYKKFNEEESDKFVLSSVYYGTDREKVIDGNTLDYIAKRGEMSYGFCDISIPNIHKIGNIERPNLWNFEIRENENKHIIVKKVNPLDKEDFFIQINELLKDEDSNQIFIFVHGYNVKFHDAARRTAQIAYDLEFDGVPVFYSWPSLGTVAGYPHDENQVDWCYPNLKEFIKDFSNKTKVKSINLIAHSMGNRILTRALNDISMELSIEDDLRIRQIILTAPDLDAEVFKRDIAPKFKKFNSKVTLYSSSNDIALKASKFIHWSNERAGDTAEKFIANDIDTIDATKVNTSFMGHSYFSDERDILNDMSYLIKENRPVEKRYGLEKVDVVSGTYWKFKK